MLEGGARRAASTPAAAAASNSTGSAAAGRPMELMPRSCAASRADDVDRRDVDELVALGETRVRRDRRGCAPRARRPTVGTGIVTRLRHATRRVVSVWCETPWWRGRSSANETRRHAIGSPCQPGDRVEHRADLDAAEPEPGTGADDARAHDDDRGVGAR